jgi:hypothetical protein
MCYGYVKSEEGGEAEVSNMSSWRMGLVGRAQSHDGPEGVLHCIASIGWPVRDYNMRGSCGDLCGYGRGLGRGSGAFCGLYPGRESCLFTIGACTGPRGHVRSMRVMCTRARR